MACRVCYKSAFLWISTLSCFLQHRGASTDYEGCDTKKRLAFAGTDIAESHDVHLLEHSGIVELSGVWRYGKKIG